MRFLQPRTLAQACEMKAEDPDAVPLAGGTDVMVGLNFGRSAPGTLLDLTSVAELGHWNSDGAWLRIGAGVTYARIIAEIGPAAAGLTGAARTVGSPQIRNRATLAGNLGTASPAGDGLPPLLASGAAVELASVRGRRTVPVAEFFTGPKTSVRLPDELIVAAHLPRAVGPQQFSKVGPRNAMVIAVAAIATALDPDERRVGIGCGAVAPTPIRASAAEDYISAALDWTGSAPLERPVTARFGELVADACSPIDDVRGGARYRRHVVGVLAARSLTWIWDEYRRTEACG